MLLERSMFRGRAGDREDVEQCEDEEGKYPGTWLIQRLRLGRKRERKKYKIHCGTQR